MEYIIHNEKIIRDEELLDAVRQIVRRQFGRLRRLGENYSKPVVADVYLHRSGQVDYTVSVVINLKGEMIYLREKGPKIEACLYSLFDRLKLNLTRKIQREKKEYLQKRRDQQHKAFLENLEGLRELKQEHTRDAFRRILAIISGDVAGYIRRRLQVAEMTTAVRRGRFKVQELLDELFLMAYEEIERIPGDRVNTATWLHRMADELLQKKFRELEFEKNNYRELDRLVEAEYRSLEEQYTVDAGEQIVPLEELDDYPEMNGWYSADDLLEGASENSLLDEVTLRLDMEEIHRYLEKELAKMPVTSRTIMDLYLNSQMSVEEVASVKDMPVAEVEAVINETGRELRKRLSFLISG